MLSFAAKTCYNRSCFRRKRFFGHFSGWKGSRVVYAACHRHRFFILLFSCEGIDHASREMDNQQALRRYREHEHHTRPTSDRYLDLLG